MVKINEVDGNVLTANMFNTNGVAAWLMGAHYDDRALKQFATEGVDNDGFGMPDGKVVTHQCEDFPYLASQIPTNVFGVNIFSKDLTGYTPDTTYQFDLNHNMIGPSTTATVQTPRITSYTNVDEVFFVPRLRFVEILAHENGLGFSSAAFTITNVAGTPTAGSTTISAADNEEIYAVLNQDLTGKGPIVFAFFSNLRATGSGGSTSANWSIELVDNTSASGTNEILFSETTGTVSSGDNAGISYGMVGVINHWDDGSTIRGIIDINVRQYNFGDDYLDYQNINTAPVVRNLGKYSIPFANSTMSGSPYYLAINIDNNNAGTNLRDCDLRLGVIFEEKASPNSSVTVSVSADGGATFDGVDVAGTPQTVTNSGSTLQGQMEITTAAGEYAILGNSYLSSVKRPY